MIPQRPLGRTCASVTIFALGGEGVLRTNGRAGEAVQVIRRAVELGVNYFDSAPAYAGCLDYLGEALGADRGKIFLASKTHDRSRDGSLRLLDDTLKRLRTGHLDLWQLHDLRTNDDLDRIFAPGGALEALLEAREDGRVRFLGITGHRDPAILLEAMRRHSFDTVLAAVNAADSHRLPFSSTVLPAAIERELGVIAMKVYAQGALLQRAGPGRLFAQAGLTAREALSYALSLPGVSTAVVGCSTPEEVEENARIASEFAALDAPAMRALEQQVEHHAAAITAYKRPTG